MMCHDHGNIAEYSLCLFYQTTFGAVFSYAVPFLCQSFELLSDLECVL